MDTGGIGKGVGPSISTTTSAPEEQVEVEGKVPGGASVKKGDADTPIKDGATSQTKTAEKKLHDFDIKVREWGDEDEATVMFDAVEDQEDIAHISGDDIRQLETNALKEAGLLFEEPQGLKTSSAAIKFQSKVLDKLTAFADKLSAAWTTFISKFKPAPNVANAMAKGVGQLVDVSVPDGDKTKAGQVVDDIAAKLETNPGAVLESMEEKGLHEVVDEIRGSIEVANTKNLGKMKQILMDHGESFPALKGMNPKARDIIINAALITARIGNAGSGKTDVADLQSRGYMVGKMPPEKLLFVETLLSMTPEQAVAELKKHHNGSMDHKGTNFSRVLRDALNEELAEGALEGMSTLFGSHEVGVETNPAAPKAQVDEQLTARNKAIRDQARGASDKTLEDRDSLLDEIRNPDTLKNFNENAQDRKALREQLKALENAKTQLAEQDGLIPQVAEDMRNLEKSLADQMQKTGASKEAAEHMAKGILVRLKLAAWTDQGSSHEVTHLGAVALGTNFEYAKKVAQKLGGQALDTVKDLLLKTPYVTSSDFEKVLEDIENRPGDQNISE